MTRFAGTVGFGVSTEIRPGVFQDVITEKSYFGDVTREARQAISSEKVNDDITVEHTIEIVADAFASDNFFAMRYVRWGGTLWKVSNVEIRAPRLLLRLGGAYHGPTPSVS